MMNDYSDDDLRGDDLKVVSYSIMYVERNHEVILHEAQEVVNYDTTSDSFAALKIAEFRTSLRDGIAIPKTWYNGKHPQGDFGYFPDSECPEKFSSIPDSKMKYVNVRIQILDRKSRCNEKRDSDIVRALDQIGKHLDDDRKTAEKD